MAKPFSTSTVRKRTQALCPCEGGGAFIASDLREFFAFLDLSRRQPILARIRSLGLPTLVEIIVSDGSSAPAYSLTKQLVVRLHLIFAILLSYMELSK
jgi:hypothetical protein